MHIPYLLDATCTGSLFELWNALDSPEPRWRRSEWQRKLLRRVCKSWKHFAETQAYRSIEGEDCLKKPHILAHARRAQLTESLKHMFTIPTLWEVVEIDKGYPVDEFLVTIVQGYHPRLRRLNMHANMSIVYAACESAAFHQLTFLHLRFPTGSLQTATLIHTTLPRLEVLIWEDFTIGFDPSSIPFRVVQHTWHLSLIHLSVIRTHPSFTVNSKVILAERLLCSSRPQRTPLPRGILYQRHIRHSRLQTIPTNISPAYDLSERSLFHLKAGTLRHASTRLQSHEATKNPYY